MQRSPSGSAAGVDRRCEIIVEMLKRFHEAREEALSGQPGDGSHVPQMPSTWNASYRELERCLRLLRDDRPKQYRQVYLRYVDHTGRTMEVTFHRGKPKLPPNTELLAGAAISGEKSARVRVRAWPDWVKQVEVDKGVRYLSDQFRGEPFLPRAFQEAA